MKPLGPRRTKGEAARDRALLTLLHLPPWLVTKPEVLLPQIVELRQTARRLGNAPTRAEWVQRKECLQKAGEAILALRPPHLEIYRGIGRHLLDEAEKLQRHLGRGASRSGRPRELGKLAFVKACLLWLQEIESSNPTPVPFEPVYTLKPDGTPRREVILFAKAVWDSEGLSASGEKAWDLLISNGWSHLKPGANEGDLISWKQFIQGEEIDWLADADG